MDAFFATGNVDRYEMLKENAVRMRNLPTEAEKLMWHYLRGNQLGVRFRRQHVIGDYIVDFVCLSKKLVVEIDGGYHDDVVQQQEDMTRDSQLAGLGFFVLRFSNDKIFRDLEDVLKTLRNYIESK